MIVFLIASVMTLSSAKAPSPTPLPSIIATPSVRMASGTAYSTTTVPFFSQFRDISSPPWQKVGCGITDLAMLINYYQPDTVSVETLLKQGVAAGAYDYNAGWIYAGLINLSKQYGLDGAYYNLTKLDGEHAYAALAEHLATGPVIASVHYKFDPKSTIPHLVVLNRMEGDTVYYNDPAAKEGSKSISKSAFLKAWKKKIIEIRPVSQGGELALGSR